MFRPAHYSVQVVGLALLLQLWCAGSSANQGSAKKMSRGEVLYNVVGCYTCHGRVGQGAYTGPTLASRHLSAEAIAGYVRAPSGVMPPYSAALVSDDDLRAISAYLDSLPVARPPSQIRLLAPYVLDSGAK
jgi:mono/diheme cytochrome c family protein